MVSIREDRSFTGRVEGREEEEGGGREGRRHAA